MGGCEGVFSLLHKAISALNISIINNNKSKTTTKN
jgi:hypothetical protein